jgi:hypothetical protein
MIFEPAVCPLTGGGGGGMECGGLELLPEIKSEIKAEDFAAAQQQQQQQQQQQISLNVGSTTPQPQQNCQWVSQPLLLEATVSERL